MVFFSDFPIGGRCAPPKKQKNHGIEFRGWLLKK
jgi:hypothetical protein